MENAMRVQIEQSRDELAGHTSNHTHIKVLVVFQYLKQIPFSKLSHHTHLHGMEMKWILLWY